MKWKKYFLFLSAMTIAVLLQKPSFAQNYFFHLLGVANSSGFVWTGLAGDNNWSTPGNWSTNAVPGVGDVALFRGASCSGANCNANITASISVLGVDADAAYAGTITQNAGQTIVVGTSGWSQAGGTFVGGDSNVTFTASTLTLSGTSSYTATTAMTYFNETQAAAANVISTGASVTLTFPDLSLVKMNLPGNCGSPYYKLNTANKVSFYNLTVLTSGTACGYAQFGHPSIAVEIRGDFTNATLISTDSISYQGTFELYGNLSLAAGDANHLSLWRWLGAANSTYSTTGSFGVGALQIEKTGGATVTAAAGTTQLDSGGIYVKTGSFDLPAALSIIKVTSLTETFRVATGTTVNVPANSTVTIQTNGACVGPIYTMDVDTNFDFQNVVLYGGTSGCGRSTLTVANGDTITVKKNLTLGSDHNVNGSWILEGNLIKGASAVLGTMSLTLQGTNAQTLDTLGWGSGPITVNKASGTATLSANFSVSASSPAVTVQSGILDMNAKNLTITNTLTVASAGKLLCNGGTLSAGGYSIAGQISCGPSAGITWTGASGDHLWTTAGNWTNNTIPGASDVAIFNGYCTPVNCDSSINTNISTKGVWITSDYPGILTQNSTRTITLGTSGWTQAGGSFAGGDSAFLSNGPFTLSAGTFTSTSGTMTLRLNVTISSPGPTFTHNSGTVNLDFVVGYPANISLGGAIFNNLNYTGDGYNAVKTMTGTAQVNGAFSCVVSNDIATINGGDIFINGNISVSNKGCIGSNTWHASGTGNQTVTGALNAGWPAFAINSTGGTVTLAGTIEITRDFTYTQGTVDPGTSTVQFDHLSGGTTVIALSSPLTLNNVTIAGNAYNAIRNITASALTASGVFTCNVNSSAGLFGVGTVYALGDVSFTGNGCAGSAKIVVAGSSTQTVSGAAGANIPKFEINSSGGNVNLSGTLEFINDFIYTQGTVVPGTSQVNFHFNDTVNTLMVLSNPLTLGNVAFTGSAYNAIRTTSGNNLTVSGTLACSTISSPATLNGMKVIATGDIILSNLGCYGTTVIEMGGSTNQTLTGVSSAVLPPFNINSTGGTVSLVGTINFSRNFTYTQGTVAAGTSTVVFLFYPSQNYTATLNAPLTLNNVTFGGSGYNTIWTMSGSALTVNGAFTCNPASDIGNIAGGTFIVNGDVTFAGYGCAGNSSLTMSGSSAANLSASVVGAGRTLTGAFTINKAGGATVTMTADGLFSSGQTLALTNGNLDISGYILTVTSTFNVGSGTTVTCNGGTFTDAALVNNGTINCPGFSTYPFQWTGAAADGKWSTASNWNGGVVPGPSDTPAFTDTFCSPNCNVTIDTPINIKSLQVVSPYTGTITQGAGNTITVGGLGWKQPAGHFVGSNANITLNGIKAKFSLTGTATFTAPSATFELKNYLSSSGVASDTIFTVGSSATFNPNGGTVKFTSSPCWQCNPVLILDVPNLFQLNNVILHQGAAWNANAFSYAAISGRTIVVTGDFTHGLGQYANTSGAVKNGGKWQIQGNYNIGSDAIGGVGSVNLTGTGNQVIASDPVGYAADLNINKASGTVTMSGGSTTLRVRGFYLDQGTFTAPTGTLESFAYNASTNDTVFRISSGTTFNVNGGTVKLTESPPWSFSPTYTVDVPAGFAFNNLIVHQGGPVNGNGLMYTPAAGRTILVGGNFTHGASEFPGAGLSKIAGAWQLNGNLTIGTDAVGGTAALTLAGTGNQTIAQNTGSTGSGVFTINKASGSAILMTNLSLNGTNQDLTITSGTLDMSGYNLSVARNISNSGTLKRGANPVCGTVTSVGFTGTAAICP